MKKLKQTTIDNAEAKQQFGFTDEIVNAKGRGTTLPTTRSTYQDRMAIVFQRSHYRHKSHLSLATICKYAIQVKGIIGDRLGAA